LLKKIQNDRRYLNFKEGLILTTLAFSKYFYAYLPILGHVKMQVKIILAYLRRLGIEAVSVGKPKFDGPDIVHTIRLRSGLAAEVS